MLLSPLICTVKAHYRNLELSKFVALLLVGCFGYTRNAILVVALGPGSLLDFFFGVASPKGTPGWTLGIIPRSSALLGGHSWAGLTWHTARDLLVILCTVQQLRTQGPDGRWVGACWCSGPFEVDISVPLLLFPEFSLLRRLSSGVLHL